MVTVEEWMDIQKMHQEGVSISEIARRTGRSRKTIGKYLKAANAPPQYTRRKRRKSKLDPYKDYLRLRMQEGVYNAQKLFDEIRGRGYPGRISILKEWIRPFREEAKRIAVVRFETEPGRQAQADWASFGRISCHGGAYPLSGFVIKLGYSRTRFVTFTTSQDVEHLLEAHIKAFEFWGGVPEEILYDNPKTIVVWRKGKEVKFNPRFIDFCAHYGFIPRLCWPGRPQTKGKVERAVNYVRSNFWPGISFESLDDLNAQAEIWCREVANKKRGSETGEAPEERFPREQLTPLAGISRYDTSYLVHCKVGKDCFVRYRKVWYSVPWQYARTQVVLRWPLEGTKLFISYRMRLLTDHEKCRVPYTRCSKKEHFRGLPRSRRLYSSKEPGPDSVMLRPGPGTGLAHCAPVVEARSLAVYERIAEEGERSR